MSDPTNVRTPWDHQEDEQQWIYEKGWKDAIDAAVDRLFRKASLTYQDTKQGSHLAYKLREAAKNVSTLTPPH